MRQIVQDHILSGQRPILLECQKPTGAWQWVGQQAPQADLSNVQEIDIFMEGRDEMATNEDFQ
jgi:hypothetical protein